MQNYYSKPYVGVTLRRPSRPRPLFVMLRHEKSSVVAKEIIIPEATPKIGYNCINPKELNVYLIKSVSCL